MKSLIALIVLASAFSAMASQRATPAERRLICNQMVAESVIPANKRAACLRDYEIYAEDTRPYVTAVEAQFRTTHRTRGRNSHAFSVYTICELKYTQRPERAIIVGRSGLKCRTH